jgi:hypothetical protein
VPNESFCAGGNVILDRYVGRLICGSLCLALVAPLGCKTTSSSGTEFWTNCQLAASPDRQAWAYVTDTALVRSMAGVEQRLKFAEHECLKQGKDTDLLALSAGGKFAVVMGGQAREFRFYETSPFDVTVCCLVDFEKNEVMDLDARVPKAGLCDEVVHRKIMMSPDRPIMFTSVSPHRELQVIDLASGKSATLLLESADACDLVEVDQRAVVACPSAAEVDGGAYEYFVRLYTIDLKQWPPVALEPRQIPVKARLNGVALSRDGKQLAYWGYSFGDFGDYHDLHGVLDIASGERRFERLEKRYGYVTAMEFAPDGKQLLVGERLLSGAKRGERLGADRGGQVSKIGLSGKVLASLSLAKEPYRIHWMVDSIVCDSGGRGVKLKPF